MILLMRDIKLKAANKQDRQTNKQKLRDTDNEQFSGYQRVKWGR